MDTPKRKIRGNSKPRNPFKRALQSDRTDWSVRRRRRIPWHVSLSWSSLFLLLRWVDMKFGVVIEESQVLTTHLNLMTDLIGILAKMFSTMSSGIWFFNFRRIWGCRQSSLVCDIFDEEETRRQWNWKSKGLTLKRWVSNGTWVQLVCEHNMCLTSFSIFFFLKE